MLPSKLIEQGDQDMPKVLQVPERRIAKDAGSENIGAAGEAVRCPECRTKGCDFCGGTGYRRICHKFDCHEHGCSFGTCSATKEEFQRDEARRNAGS